MSKVPMFSIVVPVYKVEAYLDKCVQSLMEQTYSNIEIILVDDGSPDRCGEMCDAYALEDSRIKVIHKENGGQAEARNVGIAAASGEYIVFVDSDDYVSAQYCEKLLAFTSRRCDILAVDAIAQGGGRKMKHYVNDHGKIFGGKEYLLESYRSGGIPMAAVLCVYRRMFLQDQNLSFKSGIVHEDDHFAARAFLLADSVIDTGLCEYTYLLRENSTTNRKDMRKNGRDMYTVCTDLREIFEEIENRQLKMWMVDSLVVKYLYIFQAGRLYQYGSEFIHKQFVLKNAKRVKTRCKAVLFCLSPWFYWHVNNTSKMLAGKWMERR